MKRNHSTIVLFTLALMISGVLASLTMGPAGWGDWSIVRLLRLPRTLTAIAVGGGLAVAGAATQALLSNPLADPYTMGVASAATLGAVLGLFLGGAASAALVPAFSFAAAAAYLALLLVWVRPAFRGTRELILCGVIAGFFFSSASTLVLALSDPTNWTASLTWVLGSLRQLDLPLSSAALAASVALAALLWAHWKPLDLAAVDGDLAQATGVDMASLRLRVFLITSLLTALCVCSAGVIGFVGLIVPHALRRLGAVSHRGLIPLSFAAGAGLVALSDAIGRVLADPAEVPVGVIMALLGGPVFLVLLRRPR